MTEFIFRYPYRKLVKIFSRNASSGVFNSNQEWGYNFAKIIINLLSYVKDGVHISNKCDNSHTYLILLTRTKVFTL